MARESLKAVGALLLGLLALDAGLVVGLSAPQALSWGAPPRRPAADHGWALCQTRLDGQPVTPVMVALTYLDPGADAAVTPDEIRGWFQGLPSGAIDVYLLEDHEGLRRVAFQLTRDKWPAWTEVAGNTLGEAVCDRLRAELVARRVGRPGPAPQGESPSRYDYEFIYARRPHRYNSIAWAGDLDYALAPERFAALIAWLTRSA